MSTSPLAAGISQAICTKVLPGANGPCTTTWVPLRVACGDDPCMMPQPLASPGMSNANGTAVLTGPRELLVMSSR